MSATLDQTLAALADPARRRVVDLLRERPHAAGELAAKVGVPAPAMSRHLKTLRACGLVEASSPDLDARLRVYVLRPAPIAAVRAWLEAVESLWTDQLGAFKAHIEATPDREPSDA